MEKQQTKISQIVEAIITHPNPTITSKEVAEQFPDWTIISVRNHMVLAKNKGYVEPTQSWGGEGRPQVYKILKRDPYNPIRKKHVMKKRKPTTKKGPLPAEVDMDTLGIAMVTYIDKLKAKIQDLTEKYLNINSELQKTQASARVTIRDREKKIEELKREVGILRNKIRNDSGKTFNLGEIARFT